MACLDDIEEARIAVRRHRRIMFGLNAVLICGSLSLIGSIVMGFVQALSGFSFGDMPGNMVLLSFVLLALGGIGTGMYLEDAGDPKWRLREAERKYRDALDRQGLG